MIIRLTAVLLLLSACDTDRSQPASPNDASDDVAIADGSTEPLLPIRENGQWGYIDRNGRITIEPQFDRAWRFAGGYALVQDGESFGYIRDDGTFAVEPRFDDAWHFTDGHAPVEVDGRWTYIDTSGTVLADTQMSLPAEVLVESRFDDDEAFELVRSGDRYGFRSEDGESVIDPRFEQAWRFSDGLARAKIDGKWGYIDRDGEFVIEPTFDQAWDFRGGLAMVEFGDTIGYINRRGERVWPNPR